MNLRAIERWKMMNAGVKWVVGAFCLLTPSVILISIERNRPSIQVQILRRTVEQEKPVVFFKVAGLGTNSILSVSRVGRDFQDHGFIPVGPDVDAPATNFWAPSEGNLSAIPQGEFGVLVPTNVENWKLRVVVRTERNHSWKNLSYVFLMVRGDLVNGEILRIGNDAMRVWNHPLEQFNIYESERMSGLAASGSSLQPEK